MHKKILFGLLVFCSCKSVKQSQKVTHLPLKEDGFYYRKNPEYNSDEYLLLKFYKTGYISELAISGGMNQSTSNPKSFACTLDNNLNTPIKISYKIKDDSVFFKKKSWDSYDFSNLSFACKIYGDSITARITPVDYYDTLASKADEHIKSLKITYRFQQAVCDEVINLPGN